MKKLPSIKEAFEKEGLDINKIEITGCPERHVEAAKAFIKLCVGHDAVNPTWNPDYTDYSQIKYENWWNMGSSSGVGFSFLVYDFWITYSNVGSRLVSETREKANAIGNSEEYQELFKTMMVYNRPVEKE
ncbi:hypothetical protein SDC9_135479 [bioreactor metagenome]|uniref:Uncharacterized protein n=1 Tax=bioreactor metagenome TaxID=1076179 RepID=A0A645DGB0_9ZZZZ